MSVLAQLYVKSAQLESDVRKLLMTPNKEPALAETKKALAEVRDQIDTIKANYRSEQP